MNFRVVKKLPTQTLVKTIETFDKGREGKGTQKGIVEGSIVGFRAVDGTSLFGKVKNVHKDGRCEVYLAVPGKQGVLHTTENLVDVDISKITISDAPIGKGIVKEWNHYVGIDSAPEGKAATPILDNDVVVDYRDVRISGLASTFASTTPEDRDGDYVQPGAFDRTLAQFMDNPVMLYDHKMSVENLAGHWTKLSIVPKGLAVEGAISNSPYDDIKHIRFLVVEKTLKTLSIGGLFLYGMDGHAIEVVDLWEISLVAIPANPDAKFTVREVSEVCAVKQTQRYLSGKSVL